MKKLLLSITIFCVSLVINAQNTPPTITGQSIVTLYGQQVCIDLETEDLDGDSVFIGSNTQIPQSAFINTNSSRKLATGSFCVTVKRGIHSHQLPYTLVFYATDKKDTTYKSLTLEIRNSPYSVRPVVNKISNNTFRVDVKGDKNEPWQSYKGLKFESKVFSTDGKLLLTTNDQVFNFTAPAYDKYVLYTTYVTPFPTAYTTRDSLIPNMSVSVISPQKNLFTVYPNPTTGKVFIENLLGQIEAIAVYDALGKEIKQLATTSTSFSIDNLPSGIYWVEIKTIDGALGRQKLIKD